MADESLIVVFVHGWSVSTIETYGGLPERLEAVAAAAGIDLQLEEIYLGRYISFHDEVQVSDLSAAFRAAVADRLVPLLAGRRRFVCVTHSTGGPVVRDWWRRYYTAVPGSGRCPMSHLVMLAPANFGSALAQLGKARVGRLKSWFGGVEPGQGVLDWLELGSAQSWSLNQPWIASDGRQIGAAGVFPFVLIGQRIDRKLYDTLNAYTGELGSDGVVRTAAANLNARYIRLEQQIPVRQAPGRQWTARRLEVTESVAAPATAMRVVSGRSHSGSAMGIMRSVRPTLDDPASDETVDCILRCIRVRSKRQYAALSNDFAEETMAVQQADRVESTRGTFRRRRTFFHDRYSMVVFRLRDHEGYPVHDFDLILTAGPRNSVNHLPAGFFIDRQRNRSHRNSVTYYFNHDVMKKSAAIVDDSGKVLRPALPGADRLGLKIQPRPTRGFVHYLPCGITATEELLERALLANGTTLIEIVLQRVVKKNVFRIDRRADIDSVSFKGTEPGPDVVRG